MPPNRQAELEHLRVACQVNSVEAVPKAQEFLRIMDLKCRPGALGKGDPYRTEIAFDLACRAVGCPVPHKTAAKLCGTPEAIYLAVLGTAQRLLGVQRRYTCKEIAQAVGGARVGLMATSELKRYKERFLASYPARQAASIDLDSTVYAVSAFYLCAKKLKHPVNKQRLLELSLVREAELTGVCRSMLELCYSTLGVSISDKPSKERLEQLAKTAALTGVNAAGQQPRPGSSTTSTATTAAPAITAPLTSPAETPSGNKSSRFGTASGGTGSGSSFGNKRKGDGGAGAAVGSASRRPIPLTRLVGPGGEPMSHVAAMARSIQAAAGRKRFGGSTVAAVEPGGNNDRNNSFNDRTHRPAQAKRPRPNASTSYSASAAATGQGRGSPGNFSTAASPAASTSASAAASTAAATAAFTATASAAPTAATTAAASANRASIGVARAPPSVSRAPRTPMVNPYATRAPTTADAIRRPVGGDGSNGEADGPVTVAPEASTGASTATATATAIAAVTSTAAAAAAAAVAAATATANRTSTPGALPPPSVSRVPRAPIVNPYEARATTTAPAANNRPVGRDGSNSGGANGVIIPSVPEALATATPAARAATATRTSTPAALSPSSDLRIPRTPPPPPVGRDKADHGRRLLPLHDAATQGGAVSAGGEDGPPPLTAMPVKPETSHEGNGGGGGGYLAAGGGGGVDGGSGDGVNGSSCLVPPGRREGSVQSRLVMGDDRSDSGGKGARGGPTSAGGGGGSGGSSGGGVGPPKGRSLGGGRRGVEVEGGSGRGHEHDEWRNRVLSSMENRMKASAAAAGGSGARPLLATAAGLSGPTAVDAAAATINANDNAIENANGKADADANADANATGDGDGSSRRSASRAASPAAGKSTKQASLKAFFAPSTRVGENANV